MVGLGRGPGLQRKGGDLYYNKRGREEHTGF